MKKMKILLPFLIGFFLIGCQKGQVEDKPEAKDSSVETDYNKILELTQNYKHEQRLKSEINEEIADRISFQAAVFIDVEKALSKYNGGSSVDDAILSGVCASMDAYFGMAGGGAPIPDPPLGEVNEDNWLDYAGHAHVTILHDAITVDYDLLVEDYEINMAAYLAYAQDYLVLEYGASPAIYDYTLEELESDMAEELNMPLVDFPEYLQDEELITSDEFDVFELYFEALDVSTSMEDFYDYSVTVEALIMDGGYTTLEKNHFLFGMATTRYDVQYWGYIE